MIRYDTFSGDKVTENPVEAKFAPTGQLDQILHAAL